MQIIMISQAYKVILLKFIKFGIVGFSGLFVDFGITYLCKEKFKIQKYISNSIGFTCAASTNYFLNRIWTFQSKNPEIFREYTDFIIISIIGLGINNFMIWLLIKKYNLNFYISKAIAIVVTTIWNFVANFLYTFAR